MHDAEKRPAARRATLEKLKRDAENIRKYARFAIVLGESGIEVIDNGARRAQGLPYAKIIAVLGPVQYDGKHFPEGNLLEVGYSRARPYADTKLYWNGDRPHKRRSLTQRPQTRRLMEGEFVRAYPHIVECIVDIVREIRATWKTKGTWYVKKRSGYDKGPGEVEFGIHFTVSHSDRHLHKQLILEDARHRKDKYILRHASWVRCSLKRFGSSRYTPRQLKSFVRIRRIAEMLSQDHYTPFYRTVLCQHFEDGSHERILLDSIMKAFNINVSLTEQEAHALEHSSISLLPFENLRCYRIPRQPTVHAREATVFEIFLEKEYRLSLEERSHCEDNEVPF